MESVGSRQDILSFYLITGDLSLGMLNLVILYNITYLKLIVSYFLLFKLNADHFFFVCF